MSRAVTAGQIAAVRTRLRALKADARPLWGSMTANEMIVHLTDALGHPLGDRPSKGPPPSLIQKMLVKYLLLYVLPRYPRGATARADIDQKIGGTRPSEFARDVAKLEAANDRFVELADRIAVEHPRFGPLTKHEWLRWWWMHTDHHLRQFGC